MNSSKPKAIKFIFSLILLLVAYHLSAKIQAPEGLKTKSGHIRIDLSWGKSKLRRIKYEIERSTKFTGPFKNIFEGSLKIPVYSDFIGKTKGIYYYRVRIIRSGKKSSWSRVVTGSPRRSKTGQFMTEIQEASFRYFYDFAHPVSGLSREGSHRKPDTCAVGASGFGLFNLGVGVKRKFITRKQGVKRALKILRFLSIKAQRFHGAFPHWINGKNGKVIPFGKQQDGADIVETAFLMEGILFLREYFSGSSFEERQIRKLADKLWRDVDWTFFVQKEDIRWNWSPSNGFLKLSVKGFNECHIVYILALASPTHPLDAKYYWKSWHHKRYGTERFKFGIKLYLNHGIAYPLFFTHYSYLGFDPRKLSYKGKTYFNHFVDVCRVQKKYAVSRKDFKGYSWLWGLTASMGPDGYRAFKPGKADNGTIAPTAAISSMPYLPKESKAMMQKLYLKYRGKIWGEFGFYDSLNPSRDYFPKKYLGLDTATIAPMIENYRSGMCWKFFMKAPEIKAVVKLISHGP